MRASETRIVDGQEYEIVKFSATKAVRILTRLSSFIGESIGIISDAGGMDAQVNGDMLSRAAKALFEKIDENQAEKTIKDLLENVRCEGKEILFDTHFQGRMLHLFKVIKEVLEVQYGDFFGVAGGLEAMVLNRGQSASNVQST